MSPLTFQNLLLGFFRHGGKPVLFRYYRFLEPILGHLSFSNDTGDLSVDASVDTTADSDQETGNAPHPLKRHVEIHIIIHFIYEIF